MLRHLSIRNFIIIDKLDIEFTDGLTVFTGETGAGKSIILDALNLVLGKKAKSNYIKDTSIQTVISAEFNISKFPHIISILEMLGLQSHDKILIIRRVLSENNKTRAFINDNLTTLSQVETVTNQLLEICGQHDHKGLLDPKQHQEILDQFAGLEKELQLLKALYAKRISLTKEFKSLSAQAENTSQEKHYLEHMIHELETLAIQENEEDELTEQRKLLYDSTKIKEAINSSKALIDDEHGVTNLLSEIHKKLIKFPDYFSNAIQLLDKILIETKELGHELNLLDKKLEADPTKLEEIEDRLFTIRDIARKYRVTSTELKKLQLNSYNKLETIENYDKTLSALKKKLSDINEQYFRKATYVSSRRLKAAKLLSVSIMKNLTEVNLEHAEIDISITALPEEKFSATGIDKVQFLVKTNPDSNFDNINKIASGGELSRFMLACKVAYSNVKLMPIIIFDEIDTGISGATASKVGKKLAKLAENKQIIIVTHQPQVAAHANNNYLVSKLISNEKTILAVEKLKGETKTKEIARMISGENITEESVAAAKELIQSSTY